MYNIIKTKCIICISRQYCYINNYGTWIFNSLIQTILKLILHIIINRTYLILKEIVKSKYLNTLQETSYKEERELETIKNVLAVNLLVLQRYQYIMN